LLLSVDSSRKLVEVLSRCAVTVIVLLRFYFRETEREGERERNKVSGPLSPRQHAESITVSIPVKIR